MANTYIYIASATVGAGGATTITFSGIPNAYTDLVLKVSARMNRAVDRQSLNVWFNGTTGSWDSRRLAGYDSNSKLTDTGSTTYYQIPQGTGTTATTSTFSNSEFYIANYTSSDSKPISSDSVTENYSGTSWIMDFGGGLWSNSNAINSISIDGNGWDFLQYSTAYLYGIKKN